MKPNYDTISTLSVAYSEILELDRAESLLGQILDSSPKYIQPFNAFLSACNVMVSYVELISNFLITLSIFFQFYGFINFANIFLSLSLSILFFVFTL